MRVRFFQLVTGDAGEMVQDTLGDLVLEEGAEQIIIDAPDQSTLRAMLKQPLEVYDVKTGELVEYNATTQPKQFLEVCLRTFHGSYFWCREIRDHMTPS